MADTQPEATETKTKILSKANTVLFSVGIVLGAVLVVGTYAITLSQVSVPSASASDNNILDTEGVTAACREYVVVTGSLIYNPETVNPSYVSASKLTTNETLKQALVDLGTFEWPTGSITPDEEEDIVQRYTATIDAVYDFCLNAGAYTDEEYDVFLEKILADLEASEGTP